MNNLPNFQGATFEAVWASIQENERYLREMFAETDRQTKEDHRFLNEKFAETDRKMEDTDRRMKKLQELMGSWSNNHGSFAEEYFVNSFEKGEQDFFGEKFNKIKDHVKGIKDGFEDEYDILLINGKSVGIVEVKYKAHDKDVPKVLKKANTFRANFPEYKNHQIYLGLASMSFYPELEQKCIAEGIAIIKQVGDKVIINDEHLKMF
jgi:hypothetical protein